MENRLTLLKKNFELSRSSANSTNEIFINALIEKKQSVYVFLINGIRLQGTIIESDPVSLALARQSQAETVQLVYKHSISTIMEDHVGPQESP